MRENHFQSPIPWHWMKLSNVQNPLLPFLPLVLSLSSSSLSLPLFLSLPLSPCTPVSKVYNRVLALDEVVQFTEEDEWAYHEMAANIPLFSHPNPTSVSGMHANTLELLCHCTVVSSSSCRFFSHAFSSLIFSPSPSPSPHSPSGALTPLSFLSPSLPTYLPYYPHPLLPPLSYKVLVVGGGDGGVLREVAKHKTVEDIHICEIDEVSVCLATLSFCSPANFCFSIFKLSFFFPSKHTHIQRVIEVSKRYLPQTAVGFSSPKVKVHIQDGAEFMQQCTGQFDVIITDSSDPIGKDIAALV